MSLKNRVNVARINRLGPGISTAKHLEITKSPVFILFHQDKLFRYEIGKYDVKPFVSFAQEWYKNGRGGKVLVPPSPFHDLGNVPEAYLKTSIIFAQKTATDHPRIVLSILFGFTLTGLTALFAKVRATKEPQKQSQKKAK